MKTSRRGSVLNKPDYLTMIDSSIKKDVAQKVQKDAHESIRHGQFHRRNASFLPCWMFDEADKLELQKNWVPNVLKMELENIPQDANVISSHFIYNIKSEAEEKGMQSTN